MIDTPSTLPAAPAPTPQPEPPAPVPPPAPPRLIKNVSPLRAAVILMGAFTGLFLVVRTAALEPFGVPTGSMSPALSGHHRDGFCPRCGATVRVGRPSSGSEHEHFLRVLCWNCDHTVSLASARELSGDRLLVDKNIYDLRRPRRWEMVVFRCPNPKPPEFGKPYVKRLVGLPGEVITIVDGDVFANGALVRKDLAEVRETLIPVFDMNFAPKPDGWGVRWLVDTAGDPRLPAGAGPNPRNGATIENGALVLDASDAPQSTAAVSYRHWNLDTREAEPVRVWNAYNGYPIRRDREPAVHDFYLSCEIEVTAAVGAPGEAAFDCRLSDGADTVTAEISVGRSGSGCAKLIQEARGGLGSAGGFALAVGRRYRLEFAFIDRRVALAIDGHTVVPPADLDPVSKRDPEPRPVRRIAARGCRAVVRDLKLFRDIHYTIGEARDHGNRPAVLGPHEYFVLGDNTQSSEDSRKWPGPGVPEDAFIGKPFLIHQPLRLSRVSVGGREHAFQSLDWSRLRWLH
ncbi:MAG TPA: S26 family signal peptidase [Gemmata sp.]